MTVSGSTAVLFLDVDGVLNSMAHTLDRRYRQTDGSVYVEPGGRGDQRTGQLGFDPEHVKLLNALKSVPGFAICFSSSWRILHSDAELSGYLAAAGLTGVPVFDATPRGAIDEKRGLIRSSVRGLEIRAWLLANRDRYRVRSYAVVDDDSDMRTVRHRFVQTDGVLGLTIDKLDMLRVLLRLSMDGDEWARLAKGDEP